jgi:hypothetical protein
MLADGSDHPLELDLGCETFAIAPDRDPKEEHCGCGSGRPTDLLSRNVELTSSSNVRDDPARAVAAGI